VQRGEALRKTFLQYNFFGERSACDVFARTRIETEIVTLRENGCVSGHRLVAESGRCPVSYQGIASAMPFADDAEERLQPLASSEPRAAKAALHLPGYGAPEGAP